MKQAIICDLDQCLIDSLTPIEMQKRAKLMRNITDEEAWEIFYSNLDKECKRNEWCYTLLEQMTLNNNLEVIFITGRDEKCRKSTNNFLKFKHPFKWHLYMRSSNDLRPDFEVKYDILKELTSTYEFLFALDDKLENCNVFQEFGITTLQVTSMEAH